MRGAIGTGDVDAEALVARARQIPPMEGQDLVKAVTCDRAFDWDPAATPHDPSEAAYQLAPQRRATRPLRIAAYDLGMKWNILRRFTAYGCDVRVHPATTPADDVIATRPDGVFLSNGPGDPAVLDYVVRNARAVVDAELPVFGICLGHQILAQAMGGRTYKLKFGHRGTNHPVKHLATGQVEITSQNHGFAVDPASLPGDVEVTHVNLYDGTVEGLRHRTRPVFCVQYHPEAAPGPHDADYLFRQFLEEIERRA
jgi:carbamoyl-phosphate synthase small subunit